MAKGLKPHPLVAPPTDAKDVRRLGKNGRWTDCPDPSKAKPAHAFIGLVRHPGKRTKSAIAFIADCDCHYADCIAGVALDAACQLNGVASILRRPTVTK